MLEQMTFFDKKFELIRNAYSKYCFDIDKPEHGKVTALFNFYDDCMSMFYDKENNPYFDEDEWRENLQLAGIKAHSIYKNLKAKGIEVEYDPILLKNRFQDCQCGPDRVEFHLHFDSVENLLNFCMIGTGNVKKINKMRKDLYE